MTECSYPDCTETPITNKGIPRCPMHLHYVPKKVKSTKICVVPECKNRQVRRGLCWSHIRNERVKEKYALPPDKSGGRPPKKTMQFTKEFEEIINKRVKERVKEIFDEIIGGLKNET